MIHIWVFFALASAFSLATSDAFAKKALETGNEYLVAWLRLAFTFPFLFIVWLSIPTPELDGKFYVSFFTALPIELIALVLYIKALKYSALSLTLPFLSLTPIVLIVVSFVILGERVSMRGGAGIFLIAAGSYALNSGEIRKGLMEPFRAITREKGSLMMIAVAVLYSITSTLGKRAIEHSSAIFFGTTYFMALTLLFSPLALTMGRRELTWFTADRKSMRILIVAGLMNGIMIMTHMTAMSLTNVAYMIAVKRISLLIGVCYGYFFFKEDIRTRLPAAFLMLAGFVLVITSR